MIKIGQLKIYIENLQRKNLVDEDDGLLAVAIREIRDAYHLLKNLNVPAEQEFFRTQTIKALEWFLKDPSIGNYYILNQYSSTTGQSWDDYMGKVK